MRAARGRVSLAALAILVTAATTIARSSVAGAETVGYQDFSYTGASAPTGQKPQSKLWFNDGIWWGSLFNSASTDFEIYRYDWPSHTWTTTGTTIDTRSSASMDVLWDGSRLYVATAGPTVTTTSHRALIERFTYDAATKTYRSDAGFPVQVTNGGVKSIVMAKDSLGTLWATYTQANQVWMLHSTTSDSTWSAPAALEAPGAKQIGSDELSAVVAYDGDKVGVMWSNQVDNAMYFASHVDGAPADQWAQVVAYSRPPEGADDHINLKSLQADSSGRIFAAAKTSLNGSTDPLIHLIVLGLDGTWRSHTFGTVADQHTRAIVTIDPEHRRLYMFASAPCCSGGTIYMKETSLDAISFAPGLGTPFIRSDTNPSINNPTSTKQNLSSATGLVVMAGDDSTHRYLHNAIPLGSSTTTTTSTPTTSTSTSTTSTSTTSTTAAVPPDTRIATGPRTATGSATATFTYAASTTGASFECALDGALPRPCSSTGVTYSGLGAGGHTFSVRAVTAAGPDPTPATWSWSIDPSLTSEVFSDDFESGGFTRWTSVVTEGDGTAAITGSGRTGAGARLAATSNRRSKAALRRGVPGTDRDLTASAWARYTSEGTSGSVAVIRLLDASGTRIVSVMRRSGRQGQLELGYGGVTFSTSASLPLGGAFADVVLHVTTAGTGVSTVELTVAGVSAYRSTTADLGSAAVGTVQVGSDTSRQAFDAVFDDVHVRVAL